MGKKNKKLSLEQVLDRLKNLIIDIRKDLDEKSQKIEARVQRILQAGARILLNADLGVLVLVNDRSDRYSDILIELYAILQKERREISPTEIESTVRDAILKATDPNSVRTDEGFEDRLNSAIKSLRASLRRAPRSWLVDMEVRGLRPTKLTSQFGGVEFYRAASSNTAELQDRFDSMISTAKNSEEEKQQVREIYRRVIAERVIGNVFARSRVSAVDRNGAEIAARRRLHRTIDVINFFATMIENSRSRVYFPWEAQPCICVTPVQSENEEDASLINQERFGPLGEFSFDSVPEAVSQKLGFDRASKMLANENRSDLEDRILTALQWAGRASVEENVEESFLLFAVSLESLLLTNNESDQITYRFSVRGAHLIGSNFSSRQTIFEKLKTLYRLRSAVVHSGKTEVSDADRDTIRYTTRAALLAVLTDRKFLGMERSEELDIWFEEQVIGVGQ